uniref:Polymer-forming cytoskeletal protein n=1 Tax=Eiseniibacteriota bacterium TaxID=2212470 RepID=A0A832I3K3_UNCEI
MRRLPVLLGGLAAAGLLTLLALAAPWAPHGHRPWTAARALAFAADLVARPATAQERLEFQPISPESAAALEERRARRRAEAARRAAAAGEAPAAPAAPATPVVPAPPPPPVEASRSGNIMRVGADITIEEGQTVVGDVLAVGGDVRVHGHVEGDVVAMGGDVYLEPTARVDGDVVCMGGQLHEEEGSVVGGQRVTAAGREKDRRVRRVVVDRDRERHDDARGVPGALAWLIVSLALAAGFAGIAPGRTGAAAATLRREAGPSALTGFIALMLSVPSFIAVAVVSVLLCITIIGIPVAVAALLGYPALLGLLFVWGYVVGGAALGARILEGRAARQAAAFGVAAPAAAPGAMRAALTGVGVLAGAALVKELLQMIPFLGWFGTLIGVLAWIALGVLTMLGAGAWLRNEMRDGLFARWWKGRAVAPAAPAAWTPGVPSPTAPPSPSAPPSPPASGEPGRAD